MSVCAVHMFMVLTPGLLLMQPNDLRACESYFLTSFSSMWPAGRLAWKDNICHACSLVRAHAGRRSYPKPFSRSLGFRRWRVCIHVQVMTLSCGTSEGMYQLLPGREAYQQQEPFLLAGLSTLLAGCDPGAMHALVERHPDIRSLVVQRVSAICRPGYDPDSACNALRSLTALLQVCCL